MSAPYGELVMVLGDAHVGHRAFDIPEKFKSMLTPDKMQHLISTGNLCAAETYDFFRSVAPRMHAVRGDMDDYASCNTNAEELVFEIGEFRIGVCHGHQVVPWGDREALGLLARRLDVDILVTGHTHVCEAYEMEGTWFVNPGSITGAYSPLRDDVRPSFILLSIQANTVKLYMYELNAVSGEVDIRRARFTKASSKNPFTSMQLSSSSTIEPSQSLPAAISPVTKTVVGGGNPVPAKRPQPQTTASAYTALTRPVKAADPPAPVVKKPALPETRPVLPESQKSNTTSQAPVTSSTLAPEPKNEEFSNTLMEPEDVTPEPVPKVLTAEEIFGNSGSFNSNTNKDGTLAQQEHNGDNGFHAEAATTPPVQQQDSVQEDDGVERWDDV